MKFSATVLLLASLTSLTHAVRLHRPYLIKSAENNLFLKESGGDYWKGDLKFGPLGVDGSVDFSFEPAYGNPGSTILPKTQDSKHVTSTAILRRVELFAT